MLEAKPPLGWRANDGFAATTRDLASAHDSEAFVVTTTPRAESAVRQHAPVIRHSSVEAVSSLDLGGVVALSPILNSPLGKPPAVGNPPPHTCDSRYPRHLRASKSASVCLEIMILPEEKEKEKQ